MTRPIWGRLITVVVLLTLAAGGYYWWHKRGEQKAKPQYRSAAVDRGSIVQQINANGSLNPVTVVNVGTQISGTVLRLHTDYNQPVKAGQVLAELDPVLLKAQIQQTEANLRNARAALALADSTLKRNRELVDKGFVSAAVLDQSAKEVESARAQVGVYEAQLQRDQANLGYSVIRSPIAGVVVNRSIDVGQTVAASFQTPTLFQIARDLQQMQIDTSVAEADIGALKEGQPVRFNVDAFPEREFVGRVRQLRINPTIQQNIVTYNVVIAVNNDSGLLLPGMTAHVNVVVKRKDDVLRLPAVALRFRPSDEAKAAPPEDGAQGRRGVPAAGNDRARAANGGGATSGGRPPQAQRGAKVYRLGEDGKPTPVEIKTGITDNRFVELTGEELKVGDQVILREVGKSAAQDTGTFRMRLF
ncbi:MAG: efflux RND transporter periplasmic adaptor subunit [Betaproteobacteria bacterium]|nr:efflux RND transporter periplasmic adaptor subunit [Betaproteobacteria bacterium]